MTVANIKSRSDQNTPDQGLPRRAPSDSTQPLPLDNQAVLALQRLRAGLPSVVADINTLLPRDGEPLTADWHVQYLSVLHEVLDISKGLVPTNAGSLSSHLDYDILGEQADVLHLEQHEQWLARNLERTELLVQQAREEAQAPITAASPVVADDYEDNTIFDVVDGNALRDEQPNTTDLPAQEVSATLAVIRLLLETCEMVINSLRQISSASHSFFTEDQRAAVNHLLSKLSDDNLLSCLCICGALDPNNGTRQQVQEQIEQTQSFVTDSEALRTFIKLVNEVTQPNGAEAVEEEEDRRSNSAANTEDDELYSRTPPRKVADAPMSEPSLSTGTLPPRMDAEGSRDAVTGGSSSRQGGVLAPNALAEEKLRKFALQEFGFQHSPGLPHWYVAAVDEIVNSAITLFKAQEDCSHPERYFTAIVPVKDATSIRKRLLALQATALAEDRPLYIKKAQLFSSIIDYAFDQTRAANIFAQSPCDVKLRVMPNDGLDSKPVDIPFDEIESAAYEPDVGEAYDEDKAWCGSDYCCAYIRLINLPDGTGTFTPLLQRQWTSLAAQSVKYVSAKLNMARKVVTNNFWPEKDNAASLPTTLFDSAWWDEHNDGTTQTFTDKDGKSHTILCKWWANVSEFVADLATLPDPSGLKRVVVFCDTTHHYIAGEIRPKIDGDRVGTIREFNSWKSLGSADEGEPVADHGKHILLAIAQLLDCHPNSTWRQSGWTHMVSPCTKQTDSFACGPIAMENAVALISGSDPAKLSFTNEEERARYITTIRGEQLSTIWSKVLRQQSPAALVADIPTLVAPAPETVSDVAIDQKETDRKRIQRERDLHAESEMRKLALDPTYGDVKPKDVMTNLEDSEDEMDFEYEEMGDEEDDGHGNGEDDEDGETVNMAQSTPALRFEQPAIRKDMNSLDDWADDNGNTAATFAQGTADAELAAMSSRELNVIGYRLCKTYMSAAGNSGQQNEALERVKQHFSLLKSLFAMQPSGNLLDAADFIAQALAIMSDGTSDGTVDLWKLQAEL